MSKILYVLLMIVGQVVNPMRSVAPMVFNKVQLSVAVPPAVVNCDNRVNATGAVHEVVRFGGQVNTGLSLSETVTAKEHLAVSLQALMAVKVTVVTPIGYLLLTGPLCVTVVPVVQFCAKVSKDT
jgi:hypothetical protein